MNSLTYQKIINGLIVIGILFMLLLPEVVGEIFHFIFEMFMELLHVVFEAVESSLDTLIELVFATEGHATQLIVFYVMLAGVCFIGYRFWLILPGLCKRIYEVLVAYWILNKTSALLYWRGLTLPNKIKVVAVSLAISYVIIFLSF